MNDIILVIRLSIDDNRKNKRLFPEFAKWLNRKYSEYAQKFLQDILDSAQAPFSGYISMVPSHSLEDDAYEEFRHPKQGKGKKWFLDGLQ